MARPNSTDRILALLQDGRVWTQRDLIDQSEYSPGQVSKVIKRLVEERQVVELDWHGGGHRYQIPSLGATKFNERLQVSDDLKAEIADRAYELVCGPALRPDLSPSAVHFSNVLNEEVWSKLRHIHVRRERTMILDGGTTNFAVANRLRSVVLPSGELGLWHLLVITNSPPIASTLLEPLHGPSVTILGGRVTRDTSSITGNLAERSIAQWDIVADFAVIGATAVDMYRGFCCQSEQEAAIKAMLLSRSEIKCIAMDSSKIRESVQAHEPVTFGFAPLKKGDIDILITDSGIWEHHDFHTELTRRGVAIVAASQQNNQPKRRKG